MGGKEYLVAALAALGVSADPPEFLAGLLLAAILGVMVAARRRRVHGVNLSLPTSLIIALVVALVAAMVHTFLEFTTGLQLIMAVSGGASSFVLGAFIGAGTAVEGEAGNAARGLLSRWIGGGKKS